MACHETNSDIRYEPLHADDNVETKEAVTAAHREVLTQDGDSEHAKNCSGARTDDLTISAKLRDLFKQTGMAWLCLLFTTTSFTLTVLYAEKSELVSGLHAVSGSIPYSIRLLRILSGVTDVLLQTCCFLAFEKVQWILIAQDKGTTASVVASLNTSTGVPGLFVLALRGGWMSRMFAMLRLLVIVLCPLLGIIIMSNVNPAPFFCPVETFTAPYGTGLGLFNESVAPLPALETDRLFSSSIATFLNNPEMMVDITPDENKSSSCAQGPRPGLAQTCERTVYMSGSIPPELSIKDGRPEADIAMAYTSKGYVLQYGQSDINGSWRFDATNCRRLGMTSGAVNLCIRNAASNEIQASMTKCPPEFTGSNRCLSDSSWHTNRNQSTSTSLKTSFRWADMAYHRQNGSIAWSSFLPGRPDVEAPLNATGLLDAYDIFVLGSQTVAKDFMKILQESQSPLLNQGSESNETSGSLEGLLDGLLGALNKDGSTTSTSLIPSKTGSATTSAPGTDTSYSDLTSSVLQLLNSTVTKRQLAPTDDFDFSSLLSFLSPASAIPGSNPVFASMPFAYLTSCLLTADRYPAMSTTCTNFLQNFLAVPIFWCQSVIAVRGSLQGIGNSAVDLDSMFGGEKNGSSATTNGTPISANITLLMTSIESYLGIDQASLARLKSETEESTVAIGRLSYRIAVGQAYLWTYIVFGSLLISSCSAALLADAVSKWKGKMPPLGLFPLFDMLMHLKLSEDHIGLHVEGISSELRTAMECRTTPGEQSGLLESLGVKCRP